MWNGSGFSRRPDGWLPVKSLHSCFHFVERALEREESKEGR